MTGAPPHWVRPTDTQLARAREWVANHRAAWINQVDYPAQAFRTLQLYYLDPRGERRGKVFIDGRGQVFGGDRRVFDSGSIGGAWSGSYTWAQARQHPVLLVHRGYDLEPEPHVSGAPMGWSWSHKDYDGPPDNRCGWSPTLAEARREINELEAGR